MHQFCNIGEFFTPDFWKSGWANAHPAYPLALPLYRHCKKSSHFTLALLPGAFFFVAVAFVFFLLSSASESDESIFDLVWLLEAEAEEALLDVAPAFEELVLSELLVFFGGEAFVISRVFLTGVALKKNET